MNNRNVNILFNWALHTRNENLLFILLHGIELTGDTRFNEDQWYAYVGEYTDFVNTSFTWGSSPLDDTGLVEFFDAIVSAHDFGYPKEQQSFWHAFHQLEQFDKSKTVMVDDSLSVLKAADTFGIQYIVAITKPDSAEPPRIVHDYLAVESLGAIQPK